MLKLFLYTFLFIISIGCGNANFHEQAQHKDVQETAGHRIIAGSVAPMLTVEQKGKDIVLHYSIKNQTEHPVKYTFPTSQRFEYIISTEDGEIVKKFSEGMMFAQFVSTISLKQGETLSFNPVVSDLPKGDYLVTFWLTAKEEQYKTTASFTVN